MARTASPCIIILRHEGDALAMRLGNLLHRVFHDDVAIGHFKRLAIAHVQLLLARPPFAF
ncbi:hypothetical protein P038_01813 [Brucella abortus 99-9971-135]|nr:hypothetical protein P047_00112 [Brucella abortus 99-9971-159]ERT99355.1 hypothetical protein P038_01813 [Brucella abortus 99-9971-135]